jgi:hypothetical protein
MAQCIVSKKLASSGLETSSLVRPMGSRERRWASDPPEGGGEFGAGRVDISRPDLAGERRRPELARRG